MKRLIIKMAELLLPMIAALLGHYARKLLDNDEETPEKEAAKVIEIKKATERAHEALAEMNSKIAATREANEVIEALNKRIADTKIKSVINPGLNPRKSGHTHHEPR